MSLSLPAYEGLLSRESAVAEASPIFIYDDCLCNSIKDVHNSEPFALVKMLWK